MSFFSHFSDFCSQLRPSLCQVLDMRDEFRVLVGILYRWSFDFIRNLVSKFELLTSVSKFRLRNCVVDIRIPSLGIELRRPRRSTIFPERVGVEHRAT